MSKPVTYQEIMTQDVAWQQAIELIDQNRLDLEHLNLEQFDQVIFTGCGSTYYLALAAASLFQELTQIPARGLPASELLFYPLSVFPKKLRTLLVAISRSGESTETVTAVEQFVRNQLGEVLIITNYEQKPFAKMGKINFAIPAGKEQSIAQTRAFSSMYVCIVGMAALLAGRKDLFAAMQQLPLAGRVLIQKYEALAKSIGSDLSIDRFYFLGSGPRYGLACEVSLKMKEMSLSHSEPFHFFEFRHGPKSMVTNTTLLGAFLSTSNRSMEEDVIKEMRALGARPITFASDNADVVFPTLFPEEIINVLYLPIMQLIAYYRALAKGLDPDRPTNLDAVVRLNGLNGRSG